MSTIPPELDIQSSPNQSETASMEFKYPTINNNVSWTRYIHRYTTTTPSYMCEFEYNLQYTSATISSLKMYIKNNDKGMSSPGDL